MALRKENPPAGCPDYMLTYGDMMSLLLCFFVMLVSLLETKKEEQFQAMLESLKKAFGYNPSSNHVPGDKAPFNAKSIVDVVKDQIVRRNKDHKGTDPQLRDQRQFGKSSTVKMVREGMMFAVGGSALFEPGSDEFIEGADEELKTIIEPIKGYRNKIVVRGHTSRGSLPEGSPFASQMDLSYARAVTVMNYMIENGIERDRLNLEACGGNEPLRLHAYDKETAAENERVEIVVKDTMVEDYEGSKQTEAAAGG